MSEQIYEKPITERQSSTTTNIDVAVPRNVIKQISKCEREVFKGWNGSKGIYDDGLLETMGLIVDKVSAVMQREEKAGIVLSGCGTSGRLAFMITRSFNLVLLELGLPPCLHYLIAGGDEALLVSREAPEDNPTAGQQDLQKLCESMDSVLYIGITCGLSAPYVAGQLDYCMQHTDKFIPVLLGFNPPYLARNVPIEGWDKTFHQVVIELGKVSKEQKGFLLTPIIGPEPITGSSRMKSGSATKILLETILTAATLQASKQEPVELTTIMSVYDLTQKATYKDLDSLSEMVEIAADCLQNEGHLHYVGYDSLGLVGIIDASECAPTFGAASEDVQGYVQGGYQTMRNKEGELKQFDISLERFEECILPNFSEKDLTIVLCKDDGITRSVCITDSSVLTPLTIAINFIVEGEMLCMAASERCRSYVDVAIPWQEVEKVLPPACVAICQRHLVEISCKWLCNALTTAAYVRCGKVYHNYMVDVKVSNSKLYYRAVGIIKQLSSCSEDEAEKYLLQAIYNTDRLTKEILHAQISQHIQQATDKQKVVPIALIMAIAQCTIEEAQEQLEDTPIIRTAIANSLQNSPR